ncbi:GH25 family lysozyme [Enterococcus hirae]|uniref:GH25 family lysozyme n=1 Tax=Enterococcus hirae TaxID=1354 RepID=UPI0006B21ADA|nr:GH25 family lysozyme [Enterococcus hirae]
MTLKVVDLSNNNGSKNIKDYPADAYMFKATEGCNFVDRYCDPFVQQAIKAGKPFGVYHFIDGSNWQTQTDFFINNVQGYIGKGILVLDYEMYGRQGTGVLKQMLDRIQQKTGIKALVYTSASVLFEEDFSAIVKADYGLWVAAYQSNFPKIKHWSNAAMWQYTSTPYDQNIFYGDQNTWKAYATSGKCESSSNQVKVESVQVQQPKPQTPSDHDKAVAASKAVHQGNSWAKLDKFNEVSKGKVRIAGWLVPDNPEGAIGNFAYILIMKHGTNEEITRVASQGIKRPDVKKNYVYKGGDALGMDVTVDLSWVKKGTKIDVIFRRCNQANGEDAVNDVRIKDIYLTL